MIQNNLDQVELNIRNACLRSGRSREKIKLIAVSKTKPIEALTDAYNSGIREFGENKVQELDYKYSALPADIHWHMIGHLQRNKIKYIIDKVTLIHSVDSLRLAEAINIEAKKKHLVVPILIEVNIAKEQSKFGVMPEDVMELIGAISSLSHMSIQGLMAIAPYVENPELNRVHFAALRKLLVDIVDKNIDNVTMSILSMGMTNDYEVAIEEGATMVRVGTGIFGERNYDIN